MSLPRVPQASSPFATTDDERFPAADPWQGWGGVLGISLAVLLFQVGCSAINPTPLSGLGKNLVGRWERTGGSAEVLIFGSDGSFVELRGRTEKLAREVDGWTFSTPGGKWDVVIHDSSKGAIGGFKCEFRDDEELEITDGYGLKSKLLGVYRRVGGGTVDGPPAKEGSAEEKLNELKKHLAETEKRRDTLKKARVRLEKDRLDKLAEVRKAGVTKDTPADKRTEAQNALVKELADIVQEDAKIKAKVDEAEAMMSKIRTIITRLNVKIVVDGNAPTGDDLSELDKAKVDLRMAEDTLNRDAPPMTDPLIDDILKGQLDPKESPVDK